MNIFYFMLSGIFLVLSGVYLVKSLEKISRFLEISEFSAAFILMAVATSIPELLVGISSAVQGNPSLSLGNVIGSNIINLTIITGIFILMSRGIKFKSKKVGSGVYFMFASIILVIILFLIGNSLSRIDGVILLFLFAINLYRVLIKRERYSAKFSPFPFRKYEVILSSFIFILSLIILFLSSKYVVHYAGLIAIDLEVPQIIIGLFLISIATTLPELVFGINAVLLGHPEMSIGDQIGTVFTNTTLILGIVSIISPISSSMFPFILSSCFLFLSASLFVVFVKSGRMFKMIEGIFLILLYLFFVILQFFIR
jgi:cation:H+ antiporter